MALCAEEDITVLLGFIQNI